MDKLDAPLMPPSQMWPSLQVCTWACGWKVFLSQLGLSLMPLSGGQ